MTLELVSANSLATHQERQEKETTLELFLAKLTKDVHYRVHS